jgi:hypothetical protein
MGAELKCGEVGVRECGGRRCTMGGGFVELCFEVEVSEVVAGPYPGDVQWTGWVTGKGIPAEVERWLVREAIACVEQTPPHERTVRNGFWGWDEEEGGVR